MTKHLLVLLVLLSFQHLVIAQKCNEMFTIYLVRHAEKDLIAENYADPPLTSCGEERAEHLSSFLKDVDLDIIYSTDYNRTKSTAQPTATTKELDIDLYDPQELEAFSEFLIQCKKDALIVGHSNTTAVLAGLLVGEEMGSFDLAIYNRIYQVVLYKDKGRIHLFHTTFTCDN